MSLKYSKFYEPNRKLNRANTTLKSANNYNRIQTGKSQSVKSIPKIDEKFICKFDPKDKHLFKNNARVLPCNNTACVDCIKKFIDKSSGILRCNLCTNEHRIVNIQYLQLDPEIVISMERNKASIGEDLLQQFRFYLDQLVSRYDRRESFVETLFRNIQDSIRNRVIQIKSEIDLIYEVFLKELDSIKSSTLNSLNLMEPQIRKRTDEFINFASKMNKNLNDQLDDDNLFDENLMFECENKINELKEFNTNFTGMFDLIGFTPSSWQPTKQIIGNLRPQSLSDEFGEFFKQTKALVVDLEEQECKEPHSLCLINNNTLAITDTLRRRVCIFNTNLQMIRTIDALPNSGIKNFIRPTAIYSDNQDQFYLYDQGCSKLYMIDKAQLRVRKTINDSCIEDISYCNGVLFLLDRINSAVRLYTRDAKFLKQYRLYTKLLPQLNDTSITATTRNSISNISIHALMSDPNHDYWLKNPVRIEINVKLNLIAVLDNYTEIYIYDYDFNLKQTIGTYLNGHNWSMIFFEKYLFTHTEDSLINCFEYSVGMSNTNADGKSNSELSFIPLNRLKINPLNFSWHIKIFNNRLVILAEDLGRKVLVAL